MSRIPNKFLKAGRPGCRLVYKQKYMRAGPGWRHSVLIPGGDMLQVPVHVGCGWPPHTLECDSFRSDPFPCLSSRNFPGCSHISAPYFPHLCSSKLSLAGQEADIRMSRIPNKFLKAGRPGCRLVYKQKYMRAGPGWRHRVLIPGGDMLQVPVHVGCGWPPHALECDSVRSDPFPCLSSRNFPGCSHISAPYFPHLCSSKLSLAGQEADIRMSRIPNKFLKAGRPGCRLVYKQKYMRAGPGWRHRVLIPGGGMLQVPVHVGCGWPPHALECDSVRSDPFPCLSSRNFPGCSHISAPYFPTSVHLS